MAAEGKAPRRRWPRLTIGLLMIVIAASGVILSIFRPLNSNRIVHQAATLIKTTDPSFDVRRYSNISITPSADRRYTQVVFRRTDSGPGRSTYGAIIPIRAR